MYDDDLAKINIIEDLGVNWVIHGVRNPKAQILQRNFKIIAANTDFFTATPEHLIIYFTEGYCTTWEISKDLQTITNGVLSPVGIDTNLGTVVTINNEKYWKSNGVINSGLRGPWYAQERTHRDGTNNSFGLRTIDYNLDYEIKLAAQYSGNPIDICLLEVYYNGSFVTGRTINSADLTTSWKTFSITYNVPQNPSPTPSPSYHRGLHLGNSVQSSSLYGSGAGEGVEFRVTSLTNIDYCVKSMKVYDSEIWIEYLKPSNQYPAAVRNYADRNELKDSKIQYLYSFDEPNVRSHSESYNTVKAEIQSVSNSKPLITTFFPQFENKSNGEEQFSLYKSKFNPSQLLFDYYPMETAKWADSTTFDEVSVQQLIYLRNLQNLAHYTTLNSQNGYFYVAQANSMPTGGVPLRQPSTRELNAQVMLALASGARGVFFYNFYGENSNTLGIYNNYSGGPSNPRSHLFYKIRGDIAPRLKGTLGNKMLGLDYTESYTAINIMEQKLTTWNFPINSYALFPITTQIDVNTDFHLSLFNDKTDNINNKYFFLINLNCLSGLSQDVQVQVSKPNTTFTNWRVKNIEGGLDQSFSTSNITYTLSVPRGEGYLFQVAPVVKYGGRIVSNETISSATTLTAPMTIAAGCTLTVSAVYTINSNITVEEGGRIVYTGGGSIVLTNGAQIKQNVMAVDNSNALLNNSQRKIVRDNSGMLHLVFENAGKVWYETSTDGGSTWAMRNGGQPISATDSKSPSITVTSQFEVLISYQERNGNSYYIKAVLFDFAYDLIRDVSIVATQSYDYSSTNSNPTIICDQSTSVRFLVIWREMDFGGLFYKYGSITTGPSISLSSSSWQIPGTDNNSITPSVSCLVPNGSPGVIFHLAWEQKASGSAQSSIMYCTLTDNGNNNLVVSTPQNYSNGSGYTINQKPSVFSPSANSARVVWNGVYDDGADRFSVAVFKATDNNQFWEFGENVNSVNVNGSSAKYVVAWAKTNNAIEYTPSNSLDAVTTLSDASGFSGKEIQISNGTQPVDFRALTLNTPASPPNFLKTKQIFTVNKENTLPVSNGRGGCVFTDDYQFYFSIGDISANGKPVKFIELADTVAITSAATLNKYLVTEPFSINDNTKFSYSVLFGVIDSASALKWLKAGDAVRYKVELIDDKTGGAINTFDNLTFSKEKLTKRGYQTYSISTKGFGNKSVRLRLVTESNIKADYAIHNIYSTSPVIKKASAQEGEIKKVAVVSEYALEQNYPNPFNPTTTISYLLPADSKVKLTIYNNLGQVVRVLVDEVRTAGYHSAVFNGGKLASGVYFYSLTAQSLDGSRKDFQSNKKMLLIK